MSPCFSNRTGCSLLLGRPGMGFWRAGRRELGREKRQLGAGDGARGEQRRWPNPSHLWGSWCCCSRLGCSVCLAGGRESQGVGATGSGHPRVARTQSTFIFLCAHHLCIAAPAGTAVAYLLAAFGPNGLRSAGLWGCASLLPAGVSCGAKR